MTLRCQLTRALPLLAGLLLVGCASDEGGSLQSQKMALIKGRGELICGVQGTLPGFSSVDRQLQGARRRHLPRYGSCSAWRSEQG